MKRFTDSIKESVKNQNWFSGLFLALCMPDICGALETPNERVGVRYQRWFTQNMDSYLPMLSAKDCYYFRCSCIHHGLDRDNKMIYEKVHFIPPPPHKNIVHMNVLNKVLQLQIDVFCIDMANSVEIWYENVAKKKPEIMSRIDNLIQIYPLSSLRPFISFG